MAAAVGIVAVAVVGVGLLMFLLLLLFLFLFSFSFVLYPLILEVRMRQLLYLQVIQRPVGSLNIWSEPEGQFSRPVLLFACSAAGPLGKALRAQHLIGQSISAAH